MRRKKKKIEIIVALVLAFGVFINLPNDFVSKSPQDSRSVIVINSDETIDGKH